MQLEFLRWSYLWLLTLLPSSEKIPSCVEFVCPSCDFLLGNFGFFAHSEERLAFSEWYEAFLCLQSAWSLLHKLTGHFCFTLLAEVSLSYEAKGVFFFSAEALKENRALNLSVNQHSVKKMLTLAHVALFTHSTPQERHLCRGLRVLSWQWMQGGSGASCVYRVCKFIPAIL